MSDTFTLNLPPVGGNNVTLKHFPTRMQAFIFRSWDTVPAERMAKVLETTTENVLKQAVKMGLPAQTVDFSAWMEKGYISIIRNNWYLLPYEQLLTLLGWDAQKLAFVLKEDDFLSHKLGGQKPICEKIIYQELTAEQEVQTAAIRKAMEQYVLPSHDESVKAPFDFWTKEKVPVPELSKELVMRLESFENEKAEYHEIEITEDQIIITAKDEAGLLRGRYYVEDLIKSVQTLPLGKIIRSARFGARYIYSYCGLYNDAFDVDSRVYCPDELLETYSRIGINGIWAQAVLYRMVPYPFEPSLSEGWEKRQERLLEFAERARKYGISIYLYINEPRSMDEAFFDRYPDLKGHVRGGYASMCLSTKAVSDYLENSIRMLCEKVPFLGGFFTITRSENLTNCYSHANQQTCTCPRCASRSQHELICQVNELVARGAHSVNPDIKVIAWAWGFKGGDITPEEKEAIIRSLPKDVILMHTSEEDLLYEVGGVQGRILDYSMSKIGPGEEAIKSWKLAKETGHEIAAKVQLNTTWECSTVPYLPVFGLVKRHIDNLKNQNVDHIMLSWTLGGFPSTNIQIASEAFFDEKRIPADLGMCSASVSKENRDGTKLSDAAAMDMLDIEYGEYAGTVRKAVHEFDTAFEEFPFHIGTAYMGPQNNGSANLLYDEPTGLSATMTCYCFDDLNGWRSIYPEDIFEDQFRKVSEGWKKGLDLLEAMPKGELYDASMIGYSLFYASYNQIRFIRTRDRYLASGSAEDKAALRALVTEELNLARQVYHTMLHNPTIGYEAANHYYFTRNQLAEKIVNCCWLLENWIN